MTPFDQRITETLACELQEIYDDVRVYPAIPPENLDWNNHSARYWRLLVWHHGSAGSCHLAMVTIENKSLQLFLGPRHNQDWNRTLTLPYSHPKTLDRLIECIAHVQI